MSTFIFNDQVQSVGAYRAELPGGLKHKTALLGALSLALQFPNYFGENWDALDECIRDLSWLPSGNVILTHPDLPLPDDRASLSTYLSVLKDAIEKWRSTGERKLLVVFPSDTEQIVKDALAEGQKRIDSSGKGQP